MLIKPKTTGDYSGTSNRYPTPRTVRKYTGLLGSSSIFSRSHRTWTSRVLVSSVQSVSHTFFIMTFRVSTIPPLFMKVWSNAHSLGVKRTVTLPLVTQRFSRSKDIPPAWRGLAFLFLRVRGSFRFAIQLTLLPAFAGRCRERRCL